MAALAEAFVSVRADTSKVKGDVEKGVKGADVETSAKRAGSRWGSVFSASLGAAAGAGLIKFGKDSVDAFKESEVAQGRLSDAFAKFPKLADTNKAALDSLNSSLATKTKFDDDATASGQAVLAQFKLTGTQITQLTPLLQDYAAKTGKSLPDAATVLGKATLGATRPLKAIGLNLKDAGTQSGNFSQLMSGLRTQVGGFAEKEGTTAAGKSEILKNQFGELEETVGSHLVPALTKVVNVGLRVVGWIQKNSDVMKPLLIGLGILIPTVYALNLALSLNPISLIVLGLAALAAALVVAYKKSETFRIIVTGAFTAFKFVAIPAIKFVVGTFLGAIDMILTAAAKGFGWVPGLGGKLKTAAAEFGKFRDSVNNSLDGIDDEAINVALKYQETFGHGFVNLTAPSRAGRGMATGGGVHGPGTGTSDNIWRRLSNNEHVVTAREVMGAGGHAAVEATRRMWAKGMATGGAVFRINTDIPSHAAIGDVTSAVAQRAGRDMAALLPFAIAGGPPGRVRSFRGQTLNERTIGMLLAAERLLHATFRIMQGSYSTRVAASGGTHAGGGAMDTDNAGAGWSPAVSALRRAGFAAWHRTPAQGPWGHHIHSIAIGDPTASPAAKRQEQSFLRGGDGLGMWRGGPVSFDRGGWLQPGWTLAHNGTGRPEPVGGAVSVSFTNCTFAGTSEAQFTDLVVNAVDRARSKRRI